MFDPRVEKMAEVIVDFSLEVRRGDLLRIRSTTAAEPLILAAYRKALARGANVVTTVDLPGQEETFYRYADDEQLTWVSPLEELLTERCDCVLRINALTNTQALAAIDPDRTRRHQSALGRVTSAFGQRAARGDLRWTGTLFPTAAFAQAAEMSLTDYEDFVFNACRLNEPDPVAAWNAQRDTQQRLIEWLTPRDRVRIVGPDTDLTMSIKGRTWANSYGKRNFPSGEVFTGPIETSANGTIRFTYPALVGGREVQDIRLWFENGDVVKATAARNEEYLLKMLASDDGARRLGELGIGANFGITRFTKSILFDEKIGGTIHLALGRSYPETGGENQSAIHWDMVCDLRQGGEVTVDGEVFLRDGQFQV
ncbi:MAG: aminopeptidase [Anaerolineae bacterium]